jgi:hypothetical protein
MPTLHKIGKEKVVSHHHEVPFKTLRREYEFVAPEGTPANSTGNRIIHGDNYLLSPEQLNRHGIIFKKIPRDLTRF